MLTMTIRQPRSSAGPCKIFLGSYQIPRLEPASRHALHQHSMLHLSSCSSTERASFSVDDLFRVFRVVLRCLGFLFLPIHPSPSSAALTGAKDCDIDISFTESLHATAIFLSTPDLMGTFGNIQESEQTDFPGQRIQEPRHSHKSRKLSARSCYQSKRV